ncbi:MULTISPECIES: hypothetical protein [unclassified Lactobacillus]|uniref:hypothetical protein n=1 Tax=unclassified Lactobacillus TaxID=2620435 RepID=UPI002269811C|nr:MULTISPECIES: hypothetical protein [unclassified Lactobacillus]MCX8721239.1 hypothetical protein [Lactobacillus sp. B4010]MCX8731935.1 hypothetical protein [Lactobacillus sp. B4015]MCX8734378.1 hypothetical protein [Lactobacillus sp. B4012]
MKLAIIVLPVIGLILGVLGILILDNFFGEYTKIKQFIAIVLIAVGFILAISAGVIEHFMWWTSWGW